MDLHDPRDPTWEVTIDLLQKARETLDFPFYIIIDESPEAWKSFEHMWNECEHENSHRPTVEAWWNDFARQVNSYRECIRILYPWFRWWRGTPRKNALW